MISIKIIITAIISSSLTWFLTYIAFNRQYKVDEGVRLNENLNKILDVNLQYPFLEDKTFIKRWNDGDVRSSDSSLRYQNYCLYVLNFTENVFKFYNYDTAKIERDYDIRDLTQPHCGWWKIPDASSYPNRMREILDSYCK